jgi:mitogen-activated protein kinase kinase kinase
MDSDTNESKVVPQPPAGNANNLLDSPKFDLQTGSAEESPMENSMYSPQTPDILSPKTPNSAKRDIPKRSSHKNSRSSSFQNSIPFPLITVQQFPDRSTINSIHSYDATTLQSTQALYEAPGKLSSKLKSPRQHSSNDLFEIHLDNMKISNSNKPSSPVRSQSSSSAYTNQQISTRNKSKSQINLPLMPYNTNGSASTGGSSSKRRETINGSNFSARSQNSTSASGTGPLSRSRASSNSSSTASMGYRYYTQEKAYLKKIQHDTHKDLNSKIVGNYFSYSDGDSESDDDYELFPREAIGLGGIGTSFDDEYTDSVTSYPFLEASYNHEEMENDESLPERLEWQAMLSSVLTGEVVRSEKRRLKTSTDATMKEDDLWLEIRARMCGRTLEDQKRSIADSRANVEATLQNIMKFHVTDASDLDLTLKEVNSTLLKLEYCEQLWQSTQIMKNTSALYRDPSFQRHVEALTTWSTITEWVFREIHLLKLWTGNEAIDPTLPPDRCNKVPMVESYSLVERVLKQDLMRVFDGKIKSNIGPVIERAREGHLNFREEMNKIGLPVYVEGLEKLMKFPIKLIQEIISLRLVYSKKMTNPTVLLVDQTIEDLSLYMNIALMVKERNFEYTRPIPDINWITYSPDSLFDKTVLDCVIFFFELTSSKFIDISSAQVHRGFREIDNFESQYYFLEQVGKYVEGGEVVVAIQSW